MNFQAVEQANGNLVQMFGVFTNIGGLQYTPQQKAKAICKIKDDTGTEHTVHIYQGKGQLPQPAQLNQRCQFTLSTFQGNYQGQPYTGHSGFWNATAQTAPQQPQQGPPVGSQRPIDPPPASNQQEMREVRATALIAIMSAADIPLTLDMVKEYLLTSVQFILTGEWKLEPKFNPQQQEDEPEPDF